MRSREWDNLVLSNSEKSPYQLSGWIITYFEKRLKANENWVCAFAYNDGEELIGVLPIVSTPHPLLGKNFTMLYAPWDLHTMCGDMILREREGLNQAEIFDCVATAIANHFPGFFCLKMRRVPEGSYLKRMNRTENFIYSAGSPTLGSYIPVQGLFSDYLHRLSSNFRRNLKKANNRIGKLQPVSYQYLLGEDVNEKALQELFKVEYSGWKGEQGTAIAASQNLVDYYLCAATRLAKSNILELHLLKHGDKAVAGHLAVRINRSLHLLKIGYDESYSRFAPGNLLMLNLIERSFLASDIDEIDCITDTQWHNNWKMRKKRFFNMHIYPMEMAPVLLGFIPRWIYCRLKAIIFVAPRILS